jgi:(E)-4-hydroxy-3-methyl-but-2-enyl pyrophosphate reductase
MEVRLAESAGFCWGVKHAVEKARRLAHSNSGPVFTDGPLIHNDQLMAQLRKEGIHETDDPSTLSGGTLLIRAHGIPPARRAQLKKLPVHLADATCRDVSRIQGQILAHAHKGFHTLIFGDPGHAEVLGLLGCAEGRGHVVAKPSDVDSLPEMAPVCVVSQSTQFPEAYAEIARAVRRRFPNAVILDTICEATHKRQTELVRLAGEVDVLVVVGGRNSANTLRLVELARSLKPTFQIETAAQLDSKKFKGYKIAGLTAGASTPDFVIDEVQRLLESI